MEERGRETRRFLSHHIIPCLKNTLLATTEGLRGAGAQSAARAQHSVHEQHTASYHRGLGGRGRKYTNSPVGHGHFSNARPQPANRLCRPEAPGPLPGMEGNCLMTHAEGRKKPRVHRAPEEIKNLEHRR